MHAVQAARGHPAGSADPRRLPRAGSRRQLAAVRADRLRPLQGHRLQGPHRHLRSDADHRRDAPAHHAQRQLARHCRSGAARGRAQPAPVGTDQGEGGHHVARGNRSLHERVSAGTPFKDTPWPPRQP